MVDFAQKAVSFLTNKDYRRFFLAKRGFLGELSDKDYISINYKHVFGKDVDFDNPKTFNEKLQWLKLYDRRPEYTQMVDKYEAKQYVGERIGFDHIVPSFGVWNCFDEIDFDRLPQRFVLKCTHDSGGTVFCHSKDSFDRNRAKRKLEKSLASNYYVESREWPYKNVKPRILAEELLQDSSGEVKDYKFYCFDGVVRFLMINSDRNSSKPTKADYFDSNFNWLDFKWGYDHAEVRPKKPVLFDEMIEIATKLSKGLPCIRVDLYECNNQVYFGELTFYDGGGFARFDPPEWDLKIGNLLDLTMI